MNSNIYIDIGNSNAKWKYKDKYFVTSTKRFNLDDLPKSSNVWLSNVSSDFLLNNKSNVFIVRSKKRYKSLINSYESPDQLGSDRWLAMIASYEINPNQAFAVVDIGTAVTIDFVNSSGLHLGGVIFPGLEEVRKIFKHFPISNKINKIEVGQSTKDAWSIGTLGLIVNGINHKINDIKTIDPIVNIYLTGGGFNDVERFLNFQYDYNKNLVLDGLEIYANNMG